MPRPRIWTSEQERWNARYAADPRRHRGHQVKYKYGVTQEQVLALARAQNFKCAICRKPFDVPWWRMPIDHNHVTGKVRGLLCSYCNRKLAQVEEPSWILKAIRYLSRTD